MSNERSFLGTTPFAQRANLFNRATYQEFLARYESIARQLDEFLRRKPSPSDNTASLWQTLDILQDEYRSRLPIYLVGICPICGGSVSEAIDTYSLNGPGWGVLKTGWGWYGIVSDVVGEKPSYEAECHHAKIVACHLNLNGLRPNEVTQAVLTGSEKPFVMTPLLQLDQTFVVIHALPVGRSDDATLIPRYTLYLTSYFTNNEIGFQQAMQPAVQDRSLVQYGEADYELLKWVEAGKLLWLESEAFPPHLQSNPANQFPYSELEGLEGIGVIRGGELKLYMGRSGQQPRGPSEPEEKNLLRVMITAFRQGWNRQS